MQDKLVSITFSFFGQLIVAKPLTQAIRRTL